MKQDFELVSFMNFADKIIDIALHGGNLDGYDIQDLASDFGLLKTTGVKEKCGEVCVCAEVGFPTVCLRKTYAEDKQ